MWYIYTSGFIDRFLLYLTFKAEEEKDRPVISVADEVYAKHKNSRYYKGDVVDIKTQLYYCVLFDDNSTSKDLFPEDIIVSLIYQPSMFRSFPFSINVCGLLNSHKLCVLIWLEYTF